LRDDPSPAIEPVKGAAIQRETLRISRQLADAGEWIRAGMFYVGQKYNYAFLLRKIVGDRRKFCSECVVAILKKRGVPPFSNVLTPASGFTPADLQIEGLPGDSGWRQYCVEFGEYLNCYQESAGLKLEDKRKLLLVGRNAIPDLHINTPR
jgi:hypothetical protein